MGVTTKCTTLIIIGALYFNNYFLLYFVTYILLIILYNTEVSLCAEFTWAYVGLYLINLFLIYLTYLVYLQNSCRA